MNSVSVLFVDDEEDIRFSFADRFEGEFQIRTAQNGAEAFELLRTHPDINVVVTDIRMPEMSGLELIRRTREFNQELGFIVVSGHGDAEDIIQALRLGARNYLRKPYDFAELQRTILQEAQRFHALKEEQERLDAEQALDRYVESVQGLTYVLPTETGWSAHVAFRLVRVMEALGLCTTDNRSNLALGIIEILTNAIEHGNLDMSGEVKVALKTQGEAIYQQELHRRLESPPYRERKVRLTASMDQEKAVIRIEDDGNGFDFSALPDPTEPANLFAPSGRGLLLARAFLDEVRFSGKGNVVTLAKYRTPPAG